MTLGGVTPAQTRERLPNKNAAGSAQSRMLGLVKRFGAAIQASQEARANRFVLPLLARLPEADLTDLGYTPAEISKLRTYRHLPVVSWV